MFLINNDTNFISVIAYVTKRDLLSLREFTFKVDTGALMTSVPRPYLQSIGYTNEDFSNKELFKEGVIEVAGGKRIPVLTTIIPQINIDGIVYQDVEVIVTETGNALLGIDIISTYNWNILFRDKKITTEFIDVNGQGSSPKTLTGTKDTFCAYELTPIPKPLEFGFNS